MIPAVLMAQGKNKTLSKKRVKFGENFVEAVNDHDSKKIIKMCDESYRRDQMKLLGNNEEQFLEELLSGIDEDSKEYVSVELDNIEKFELVEIDHEEVDGVLYQFMIHSGGREVLVTLILTVNGKSYGFLGAAG